MNEDNSIGFEVRARILPQIEGAEQFEQNLRNIPNQLNQTVGDIMSTPGWQQNLTTEQVKESQEWLKYSSGLFQSTQDQTKDFLQDMDTDMSGGKITKLHIAKYMRNLKKMEYGIENMDQDVLGDFKGFMGTNATPEVKEKFMLAWKEGKTEAIESMEAVRNKVREVTEAFNQSNKEAESFYTTLKKAGTFALGGMVVSKAMEWATVNAQVEAREQTAFDLTSQAGMYSERRQYETFKETREREVLYSTIGGAIGGVLGALIPGAGALGSIGGAYFGNQMGTQFAGIENLKTQAETEKELKIVNSSYGTLSGYVNQSSVYDIQRARSRARGINGSDVNLGYMPEQEQQMRMQLQETLGHYDQGLYNEQTTFGRATGLDPSQIYKLNLSARVTGQDVGIGGLDSARGMAREIYGPNAAPSRTMDILTELKNIAEAQLKLNINADSRDIMRMAQVPEMIFGAGNPYGRLGDLGGSTIKTLEDLGNPQSLAQEGFLYQAYGEKSIWNFTERLRGGIYSGKNLPDTLNRIRSSANGSEDEMNSLLYSMLPKAQQGFVPAFRELLMDDTKYKGFIDKYEHPPEPVYGPQTKDAAEEAAHYKEKILEEYNLKAKNSYSETEGMNSEIRKIQNETADEWRKNVLGFSKDMAEFWGDMSSSEKLHLKLVNDLNSGMEYLHTWMADNNLLPPAAQKVYDDKRPSEIPLQNQGQVNRASYLLNKLGINPGDIIGGHPDKPYTGKILEDANTFSKWFGNRYDFSLIPGDRGGYVSDHKGHVDHSMHYQGSKDDPSAIDFRVYDKKYGYTYTKADMPKGSEIELFIEEMAKALHLRSGTAWEGEKYDPNHLDKKIDVHVHVSNNTAGLSKIQNSDVKFKSLPAGF